MKGEWYRLKRTNQYIRVLDVYDLQGLFMVGAFVLPQKRKVYNMFPEFKDVELVNDYVCKCNLENGLISFPEKFSADDLTYYKLMALGE